MRSNNVSDPVYAPNSKGGPKADTEQYGEPAGWHTDGDMVHAAYTLHAEDDDWGQAGTLVREVMDDAARDRLASNIGGAMLAGVAAPELQRPFSALGHVDKALRARDQKGHPARQDRPAARSTPHRGPPA